MRTGRMRRTAFRRFPGRGNSPVQRGRKATKAGLHRQSRASGYPLQEGELNLLTDVESCSWKSHRIQKKNTENKSEEESVDWTPGKAIGCHSQNRGFYRIVLSFSLKHAEKMSKRCRFRIVMNGEKAYRGLHLGQRWVRRKSSTSNWAGR